MQEQKVEHQRLNSNLTRSADELDSLDVDVGTDEQVLKEEDLPLLGLQDLSTLPIDGLHQSLTQEERALLQVELLKVHGRRGEEDRRQPGSVRNRHGDATQPPPYLHTRLCTRMSPPDTRLNECCKRSVCGSAVVQGQQLTQPTADQTHTAALMSPSTRRQNCRRSFSLIAQPQ